MISKGILKDSSSIHRNPKEYSQNLQDLGNFSFFRTPNPSFFTEKKIKKNLFLVFLRTSFLNEKVFKHQEKKLFSIFRTSIPSFFNKKKSLKNQERPFFVFYNSKSFALQQKKSLNIKKKIFFRILELQILHSSMKKSLENQEISFFVF